MIPHFDFTFIGWMLEGLLVIGVAAFAIVAHIAYCQAGRPYGKIR